MTLASNALLLTVACPHCGDGYTTPVTPGTLIVSACTACWPSYPVVTGPAASADMRSMSDNDPRIGS
jgi:hypothetical protein